RATGLPLLGINTRKGDAPGDFGLCALPDRHDEAAAAVDEAMTYAAAVGARAVHVMAGKSSGPEAEAAFRTMLARALDQAQGRTVLIEPLNPFDAPGYFLRDTAHALDLIADMAAPNLKLMFDCYHVARTEGDVLSRLEACWPAIGHIQFASVPDRQEPDCGTLEYGPIFDAIDAAGWDTPLGAEYRPRTTTEDGLAWMR
ncbi:MAG: hydroxypyruvate isomerase family protein, partial [Paracoccaceae bacterium]